VWCTNISLTVPYAGGTFGFAMAWAEDARAMIAGWPGTGIER